MLARDIMIADPETVDADQTVREALEVMLALGVRHLPVTCGGRLTGIVSDRDVRQLTIPVSWNQSIIDEENADAELLAQPVTTVMSGGTLSVMPGDAITRIIDLICEHRVGALPVVERSGEVVGIISYVDVLRALRPED